MHSGNQPPRKAYMHSFKPPRSVGRWAPLAAAILGSAALAAPASAAFTSFDMTYNTADVLTDAPVAVSVSRVGVTGTTAGDAAAGEFGINSAHLVAGGIAPGCWAGFTPQILPGDSVSIEGAGSMVVPDITSEKPIVQGGDVVVHGTSGGLTADALSVQLIPANADAGTKFVNGKQTYDTARRPDQQNNVVGLLTIIGNTYTARFTGLAAADLAVLGTSEATFDPAGPAVAAGALDPAIATLLHYQAGGVAAGVAGCPAYAPNEAKSVSRPVINSNPSDLTVSGVAQPAASATAVTLTDSVGNAISAPASGGAWTANVPAAQLHSLADGPISIGSTYNIGKGATVKGLLTKDATAPSAPTASVSAGTYSSAQNVSLSSNDGTIRYTTDGSDPTASSRAYSKAITVGNSQTIKAVAMDAAGNMSDVSSFGYQIVAPAAPVAQPVVAPISAPKLKLDALTLGSRYKLATVRKRGFSMVVFAPEGAKFVRVRLLRNGQLITRVIRKVSKDGVITITLPTSKTGRRHLKRGSYKVQVTPGQTASQWGTTTTKTVRIR